jgi:hypothetical protein
LSGSDPIFLDSRVEREGGGWVVYLEFLFPHGLESKRIGSYRSEGKARVAARWMSWAARREIGWPRGL